MKYTTFYALLCSLSIAIFLFISSDLASPDVYGTDLTRYYHQYLSLTPELSFSGLLDALFVTKKDQGFNLIFYFLKILGLPFYTLLFGFQFLYFYSSFRLYSLFSKVKGIFGFVPVYLYLSLFLSSLTLVALRQGISLYVLLYLVLPNLINKNHFKSALLFVLSISIHLSSVLILPFYLAFTYAPQLIRYIFNTYPIFLILYFIEAPSSIQNTLQLIPIDLARALLNNESGYEVGVTLGKALAITVPWLIYFLSKDYVAKYPILYSLYSFQFYIFEIGILFSGFPYHDRIFLIAWPISPVLVSVSAFYIFSKYAHPRFSN